MRQYALSKMYSIIAMIDNGETASRIDNAIEDLSLDMELTDKEYGDILANVQLVYREVYGI